VEAVWARLVEGFANVRRAGHPDWRGPGPLVACHP